MLPRLIRDPLTRLIHDRRPAICNRCDEFIDPMDVKCFSCDAPRTRANMELYSGISAAQLKAQRMAEEAEDEDSVYTT